MPLDLPRLFIGTLIYNEPMAALDDLRFERILRGFAGHYLVHPLSQTQFALNGGRGLTDLNAGMPLPMSMAAP